MTSLQVDAAMRVGELRQFCTLLEDGQSMKLARTIADLAGALHAPQPPQADDRVNPIANPKAD